MKAWFLFFIGTIAFFLYKYIKRGKKAEAFNMTFWFKDNWQELLLTFLFDFAAMLIVMDSGTSIDLTEVISFLPAGIVLSATLVVAFFVGFGGGAAVYSMLKRKVKSNG